MKSILNYLKQNKIQLPVTIGRALSNIPFSFRPGIGKIYSEQISIINKFDSLNESAKHEYIYSKFFPVFKHAYQNIPFYRALYLKNKIKLEDIRTFDDIQTIPIINKKDLLSVSLEERSFPLKNRILVNTGGSSGSTLHFYIDPMRYGNEWAHIHSFWDKLGYKPNRLKLMFHGYGKLNNGVEYDPVRNSFRLDINISVISIREKLIKTFKKYPIEFFHGYPSAIYNFALQVDNDKELLHHIKRNLKGIFFSSEYPQPLYRDKIIEVFNVTTQAFYGHTESCIIAHEQDDYKYKVMQTYGFAEAVQIGDDFDLVGTSFYNFASPLIRYSTEDLVKDIDINAGLLSSFNLLSGRKGEFIKDRKGNLISLTGLIFGRHHEIFNYCKFVQISQIQPGFAIIYIVTQTPIYEFKSLFNLNNIDIDFEFVQIENPVRTKAGKIKLLIDPII